MEVECDSKYSYNAYSKICEDHITHIELIGSFEHRLIDGEIEFNILELSEYLHVEETV